MYRQGGKDIEISSVSTGPYAGGARRLDWLTMPEYAKARLIRALSGAAPQSLPIIRARDNHAELSLRALAEGQAPRAATPIALSLVGLVIAAIVLPFGRVVLPWPTALLGGVVCGLTFLVARAALRGRGLRAYQGRHVLPLDVVEIRGNTLIVTPLGNLDRACIEEDNGKQRLRLMFPEQEHVFPLPAQHQVVSSLEHSHTLLQKYTHGGAFAEAIERDPFFEIRSGDHWAEYAPSARAAAQRKQRGLALGVLALVLGTSGFAYVRSLSAEAIWRKHVIAEDYLGYLRTVGTTGPNAQQAKNELTERGAKRGSLELGRSTQPTSNDQLAALSRFETQAKDADAVQRMSRMIGDRSQLFVWFESLPDLHKSAPNVAASVAASPSDLARRNENVGNALRIAISQAVPREVMPVIVLPAGQTNNQDAYLAIKPSGKWRLDRLDKPGLEVSFHVVWHVRGLTDREFRLTVPPPERPMATVRKMSLFSIAAAPDIDVTVFAETARAWDRLYDELFSLFFAGDPRVPVSLHEELKDFADP
jgi:hypothetical protein